MATLRTCQTIWARLYFHWGQKTWVSESYGGLLSSLTLNNMGINNMHYLPDCYFRHHIYLHFLNSGEGILHTYKCIKPKPKANRNIFNQNQVDRILYQTFLLLLSYVRNVRNVKIFSFMSGWGSIPSYWVVRYLGMYSLPLYPCHVLYVILLSVPKMSSCYK